MLYAIENELATLVCAADSLVEFEDFVSKVDTTVVTVESLNVISADYADMMEMLTEDIYQGFQKAPLVVIHADTESQKEFQERFDISVGKRNFVIAKQVSMLEAIALDPWHETDGRTIEEIHDLTDNDKWDRRTDEERDEDEAMKKAYNDAKANDGLSGDSFGPNLDRKKKTPEVIITDIHSHRQADGEVILDRVLSVKGLHDKDEDQPVSEIDDELVIDLGGIIAIYHKVEVTGAKLEDINPCLVAADFDIEESAVVKRNSSTGCWFALMRQYQAEQVGKALEEAGFDVEVYAVNDAGERLVPKGVQIVTEEIEGEQQPRPWNYRSKEIGKMKAAEKRENIKTMSPKEFIFVGNYENAQKGTIIYITPRLYFNEHGKMWPKPLNIEHLLPADIKELAPGVYRTHSRDWNKVSYDLNARGFKEQIGLQIWLNNQ